MDMECVIAHATAVLNPFKI